MGSPPISRVLSSDLATAGQSFSGLHVTVQFSSLPGSDASHVDTPLFGLARMGFTVPSVSPRPRWALTPPFTPAWHLLPSAVHFCCPARRISGHAHRPKPAQIDPSARITPSGAFRRFCLAVYDARPLAGILL